MIATILSIAGIILGSLFLLFIVILFLPFTLRAEFALSETTQSGRALVSWMHPRIVRLIYDINGRTGEIGVLGWKKVLKEEQAKAHEPPETPAQRSDKGQKTEASASSSHTQPPQARTRTSGHAAPAAEQSDRTETRERPTGAQEEKSRTRAGVGEPPAEKSLSRWDKAKKTWIIIRDLHIIEKLYRWCIRVVPLCFRLVRFDHFRLHATAGIEDPDELGKIYGWYASLNSCLFGARKNVDIRFTPLFLQEQLAFEGSIGFRSSMARLAFPVAVGLLTFPYLKMYLAWRRLKKVYR